MAGVDAPSRHYETGAEGIKAFRAGLPSTCIDGIR